MTAGGKRAGSKKPRPTIGLIIGRIADVGYAATVWPGVAAVAEERDVNLICFVGGVLNVMREEFDAMRNVIYDLVSPQNVDGLVAMSGSLGQFAGPEELGRFYGRFRPLPLVSIAVDLGGAPCVLVDNQAGMRSAVAHLIEVHGFRRIAFIRGPESSVEAEVRYRAYREVLEEHGLPFDPDLVTEGTFMAPAGEEAVGLLVDRRKAEFQALVSANDAMAIGAVAALRERGICVPEDVRVVGFDDLEEARYAVPPMTTVRQPSYQQGRKAAEMLLDLMAGEPVPDRVILPTELVVRQSCGCYPQAVDAAAAGAGGRSGAPSSKTASARRRRILADMKTRAGEAATGLDPGWPERLLRALTKPAGNAGAGKDFLYAWEELLRRVGIQGGDVMRWRSVIDILRREASSSAIRGRRQASPAVWQAAKSMVGEVAQWAQAYRRLQAGWFSLEFATMVSEPLMTAFDIAGLADVVAAQLPKLGIRRCYLSLYEPSGENLRKYPSQWSRLILAYDEQGRMRLKPGGRRFPSRELVPGGILASKKRFSVVLEPLHFRDENHFGFILFDPLQSEAGLFREVLSRQIGTALKGAMLLQERRQAEEAIRAAEREERLFQERLRTLLEVSNELSRAGSVDDLCRQAVELGRSRLGFDRLGIWFHNPEKTSITGSFGTDSDGNIADEREKTLAADYSPMDILRQTRPVVLVTDDVDLRDGEGKTVGRGMRAEAAMWDGEKAIGWVSVDNLLRRRPISEQDCELLNLYASTLGYLCSRKRAEDALKEYSGRLEEMVEQRTRALQEAQENLVRQEKLAVLGQLSATVSHELRNPLATIRVSAADLERKVRDRGLGAERPLDRIQRSISRCDNIISELLDYARMPAPNLKSVDIDDWLNRLLDEQTLPPGITLVREISSAAVLAIDPERLRRAIINLVDNARQAMQGLAAGAPKILTVRSEADAGGLTITVSDTGPGISPEVTAHLFEPLFSTKGFGVGLGLSVVKGIVEQHGGGIRISSPAGEGVQAVIRLPRTRGEERSS